MESTITPFRPRLFPEPKPTAQHVVGLPRLVFALFLGVVNMPAYAQDSPAGVSVVSFRVVDPFGRELPYRVARFASGESKRDYAPRFRGLLGSAIPFGEYTYQIARSDYPVVGFFTGKINVDRAEVARSFVYRGAFRVVGDKIVEPTQGRPPGAVIRGTIRPVPEPARRLWIRIQSVYDEDSYEAPVEEHGGFRIEEYLRGSYMLTVTDGERVLYLNNVIFRSGSPKPKALDIDLSGPHSVTPIVE